MFEEVAYRMEMQEKTADFQKRNPGQEYSVRKATIEPFASKVKAEKQQISRSVSPGPPKSAPRELPLVEPSGGKGGGMPNIPATSFYSQPYRDALVQPQNNYQGPTHVQQPWGSNWQSVEYAKGGYGAGGRGKYGGKGTKGGPGWTGGRGGKGKGLNDGQKGGKGENFGIKGGFRIIGGKGNIGGKDTQVQVTPPSGTQQAQ